MSRTHLSNQGWGLLLALLMAVSSTSLTAESKNDLDVTMRMVLDDQELSGSMVQELTLPESLEPGGTASARDQAADIRDQARTLGQEFSGNAKSQIEDFTIDQSGDLELPLASDDIGIPLPGDGGLGIPGAGGDPLDPGLDVPGDIVLPGTELPGTSELPATPELPNTPELPSTPDLNSDL